MRMLHAAFLGLTVLLTACEQQKTGLAAASDAMGATNLNSIEYSGSGFNFGTRYDLERFPLEDNYPLLRRYLGTPDNPALVIYRIRPTRVRHMKEWALHYHEVSLTGD